MSTSSTTNASSSPNSSASGSSLSPFRSLLSKLNWRPVADLKRRQQIAESRIQQLGSEQKQIENEIAQLKNENARYAELNAKLAALWPSSSTNSTPPSNPAGDCAP